MGYKLTIINFFLNFIPFVYHETVPLIFPFLMARTLD